LVTGSPELAVTGGVDYIPVAFIARAYSNIHESARSTRISQRLLIRTHASVRIILVKLLFRGVGGSKQLLESFHDIWDHLKTIVVYVMERVEGFSRGLPALKMMTHLMELAVAEMDVGFIFFLSEAMSRELQAPEYRGSVQVRPTAQTFYKIAWAGLVGVLPNQNVPVASLRKLVENARTASVETGEWETLIDQYEEAKAAALIAASERRLQAAESHARELLQVLEQEQARLEQLRQARNKGKQTDGTGDTSSGTESRTGVSVETVEHPAEVPVPPEVVGWEQTFADGVKAFSQKNMAKALVFFEQALGMQPGLLQEAQTYSAMADSHFVPGERQVREVHQQYGRALVFLRRVELAGEQRRYPDFNKQALNRLAHSMIDKSGALIEPIKQASRYHLEAVDRLRLLGAEDIADPATRREALQLLQILLHEAEEMQSMLKHLKLGTDALIESYELRKSVIYELAETQSHVQSEEARTRGKLKSVQKKITSAGVVKKTGKKTTAAVEKDDDLSQANFDSHYQRLSAAMGTFNQAVAQAKKLEKSWHKFSSQESQKETEKLSPGGWGKIRGFITSPEKKLSKNAVKKLVTRGRLERFLANLGSWRKAEPAENDILASFLASMGLQIVDVEANHFCMFNAIVLWLQNHPDIALQVNNPASGQDLFLMLAPMGIQLGQLFPGNVEMNAMAAAFTVNCPNSQMWGTDEMLHALVSPLLGIHILVFSVDQINEQGEIIATLYDDSGSINHVTAADISHVLTENTMVLVHAGNHWQVVLPTSHSPIPGSTDQPVNDTHVTEQFSPGEGYPFPLGTGAWIPALIRSLPGSSYQ
ncbi:MAG: hypothetical protein ACR2PT_23850, partial [Endozoicomonas sp.]